MFVKPKDGYKIRDPYKRDLIPVTGREVPEHDIYWQTLLRDKDVELTEPPAIVAPPAAAPEVIAAAEEPATEA
jgi:hypothetical protein